MAVVTGTPVFFGLSGLNPAGQSITVPSDAQYCVFMSSAWHQGVASALLDTISLTGADAFTIVVNEQWGTSDRDNISIAIAKVNSTGSQTIDWSWTTAPTEGPGVFVFFVKDADATTPVRDSGFAFGDSSDTAVTASADSTTSDLVIGYESRYASSGTELPPNETGWTSLQTGVFTLLGARIRSVDSPGASITTITDQGGAGYYPKLGIVSIRNAASPTLTISATEGDDTSSIPVTVQIPTSGDAQYRHAYGSAPFGSRGWRGTAAAGGDVTLTVSATEGADTSSITVQQNNNATISATEGNDTSSLPVTQVVTVSVAATEGADTSSISGTVQYVANIAATEGADTSSITVQQNNRITVAATEGDDTSSITVEVQGAGPEITIAATEGPDSAAFQTTVTDRLTLTALESDDAAGLTVTVTDLLNIAATEADDVSSISVQLAQNITALIQAFESPDASSINIDVEGAVVATGEFMVTIRRRRRS